MQREPVPSGLVGRQRLAAPLPVHPGQAGDVDGLVVDGDAAARLEKRLAVIIRRLSALRFAAVAGVALQHQRPVGVEPQRIAEIGARRLEVERRDASASRMPSSPRISQESIQARNGLGLDAGLADAAARKGFADSDGCRRASPRHGPSRSAGWPSPRCCAPGCSGLTKQRPLRAIGRAAGVHEIRGHVPPLDAKLRMRAVIGGKRKALAGHDGCKSFRVLAEPGKALRARALPPSAEQRRAPPAKARRDMLMLALIGKNLDQAGRLHPRQFHHRQAARPAAQPASQRQAARAVAAGRHGTAAASRTPSH